MHYIGETSQHFYDRRSQHATDVLNREETNGIYDHLKRHKSHNPANILENVMNIKKGTAINDCWTEFNAEMRRAINRKLERNRG